jgi:hypothetical protein
LCANSIHCQGSLVKDFAEQKMWILLHLYWMVDILPFSNDFNL